MAKEPQTGEVKLKDVRLAFASLFEPNVQKNEDGTERKTWKANFLMGKGDDGKGDTEQDRKNLGAISKAYKDVMTAKFGPDRKKWPKIKADKKCLRDGDEENWDGYEGNMYLSANSKLERRPRVITNRKDAAKKWIEADLGEKACPYSGCYVNVIVRIWFQDNEHGRRVNASLEAVQFLRDGEPFGAGSIDVDDAFDEDDVGEYGEIDDPYGSDDDDDDDDGLI